MITNIYIFVSAVMLGTLGLIWARSTVMNLLIKVILLTLACTGAYLFIRL